MLKRNHGKEEASEKTPLEKLRDLTRRVLSVPKSEVDKQERKHRKKRRVPKHA